jgi:hypothetical protein
MYNNMIMLQDDSSYSRKEASGQGWQEHFVDQLAASKTQSVGEAVSKCLSYVTLSNFATVDEMKILHQAAMDVKTQLTNKNDGTYVMGATVAAHYNCTRYSVETLLNSDAKAISAVFLNRLLRFLDGTSHWEEEEENGPIKEEILELGRMVFGHADWKDSTVKWYSEPDDSGTLHPEPKVNIYELGGYFKIHEDGMDLTLLVVLNDSFEGGGTAFYCHDADDDDDGESAMKMPDRIERAKSGTAIIWGGSMKHMGLPITSGQRAIFVGSFELEEKVRVTEESAVFENEQNIEEGLDVDRSILALV